MASNIELKSRILGGLWGAAVGDALGVPVEFCSRSERQTDPVSDMRGYGTHHQAPGTWSDDTSLALCTAQTLLEHGVDVDALGKSFVRWLNGEIWTPHGSVFDVGMATSSAIGKISRGTAASDAGGAREQDNGNGSLMRMLPLEASLWVLLTSAGFEEAVLKAVNLGDDTDTMGAISGGLAGAYYGLDAVPARWRRALARRNDLDQLFDKSARVVDEGKASSV